MVLSPERESNLPKENLSKTPEEKGFEIEKSRIHGVKVLLDIVKMGIKENYITSAESVEWLCEVIKKARSEGIDYLLLKT